MTTKFDFEKKQEADSCVEYFKECGYSAKRKGASVSVSHNESEVKDVENYYSLFKKYVLCGIM